MRPGPIQLALVLDENYYIIQGVGGTGALVDIHGVGGTGALVDIHGVGGTGALVDIHGVGGTGALVDIHGVGGTGALVLATNQGVGGTGALVLAIVWVTTAFRPIALVKTSRTKTATTNHLFIDPPSRETTRAESISGGLPSRGKS